MNSTEQMPGLSVLDHGKAVWNKTQEILEGKIEGMKLPQWFIENRKAIIDGAYNKERIEAYTVYHDCGKPLVRTVSTEGRVHFPGHAEASANLWLQLFPEQTEVAELMRLDMLLHTATVDEVASQNLSKRTAFTLILVAFAELHANAEMFGGTASTSFKIKFKKLRRNAKKAWEVYS